MRRGARQILMSDCRGMPSLSASKSSRGSIHSGKSTLTRLAFVGECYPPCRPADVMSFDSVMRVKGDPLRKQERFHRVHERILKKQRGRLHRQTRRRSVKHPRLVPVKSPSSCPCRRSPARRTPTGCWSIPSSPRTAHQLPPYAGLRSRPLNLAVGMDGLRVDQE